MGKVLGGGSIESKSILPPLMFQAFKYIFTLPSSVEKEPKATHSENAYIHGMVCIMLLSVTYIATQVCHLHFYMPI